MYPDTLHPERVEIPSKPALLPLDTHKMFLDPFKGGLGNFVSELYRENFRNKLATKLSL